VLAHTKLSNPARLHLFVIVSAIADDGGNITASIDNKIASDEGTKNMTQSISRTRPITYALIQHLSVKKAKIADSL
jgi:hypothetical protein